MPSQIVPWTTRKRRPTTAREDSTSGAIQRNLGWLFNEFLASSIVPEVLSDPLSQFGDRSGGFSPHINVIRTDGELTVLVEVPGMDERDIELSLTKEGLIIRGERKPHRVEHSDGAFAYVEAQYGAFERIVPLTDLAVDEDRVEATSNKGVVTIVLPFREIPHSSPRKVSIRPS